MVLILICMINLLGPAFSKSLADKFAVVLLFQEEVGKRRDFRQECVVTIDPDTARVC